MISKLPLFLDAKIYKDPRLKPALQQLRDWMGPRRQERPEGYLNIDKYFYAYVAYYLPLHFPELYWILDQIKKKNFLASSQSVLDVGCGPGTLSLSLLVWLQEQGLAEPEKMLLWDHSPKALQLAKEKLSTLVNDSKKIITQKVKLPSFPVKDEKFDLILMGHFLTEWGSGPRFRSKKKSFLKNLLETKLSDEGTLIVLEPPLKEGTLDLMYLRDEFAQDYSVVAPCPQSTLGCPMLKSHLGWCYAQPSREDFRKKGLAPYDTHLEKILKIKLTHPGFSYLVLTKKKFEPPHTKVFVSQSRVPKDLVCNSKAKIVESSHKAFHRGEIVFEK